MTNHERSECKPDAERKRDSAQPQGRAQPSIKDTVISKIADAIAFAEGYNALGSRPRRNNNPGDLEQDVTGKAVGHDGPYVIYASPQDGLEAMCTSRR
jgi:hypothetical protein